MKKIAFVLMVAAFFSGCSSPLVKTTETRESEFKSLSSVEFILGMKGAENVFLLPNSSKVYVTDLSGVVYLLDENSDGLLEIQSSLKLGNSALGITQGKDGNLYVNASEHGQEGWLKYGGEVYRVDTELTSFSKVTGKYPGINGLSTDPKGNLYFSIGDLEFFFPDGAIYKMSFNPASSQYEEPVLFLNGLGSANGVYYSDFYNTLLFTETFSKVSMVNLDTKEITRFLDKTKIVDGFDDLCVDSKGRVWLAEPVGGFLKMYDPNNQKLIRFNINGLGVASSCKTKTKDNEEYIYVTEREISKENDGRGMIVIPIRSLIE